MSDASSRPVPRPPRQSGRPPNLGSFEPIPSSDVDDLLAKCAEMPEFAELLRASDVESKLTVVRKLDPAVHQRLYSTLITVTFHLKKLSRFAEALDLLKVQLELVRLHDGTETSCFLGLTQPRNMADTLCELGSTYMDLGDYTMALGVLLDAEMEFEKDARRRAELGITEPTVYEQLFQFVDPQANLHALIAQVYETVGSQELALQHRHKSQEHAAAFLAADQGNESHFNLLLQKGRNRHASKDYEQALGLYRKALRMALEMGDSLITPRRVVTALMAMGGAHAELKLYRRALSFYQKALELNKRGMHRSRMLQDCAAIGRVHEARKDIAAAVGAYEQALDYCSVERQEASATEGLPLVWKRNERTCRIARVEEAWPILQRLAELERTRRPEASADYLRLAIDAAEHIRTRILTDEHRIGYQGKAIAAYDAMIELQCELYEADRDPRRLETLFAYIERAKSRVLLEQLAQSTVRRPAGVPDSVLEEESRLLTQVEDTEGQLMADSADLDALAHRLDELHRSLKAVWGRIAEADPEEGAEYVALRMAAPVSYEEARLLFTRRNQRAAVIEYYLAPERLIILMLHSDRPKMECYTRKIRRQELRDLAMVNAESMPALDLRLPYWELDFPPLVLDPIVDELQGYELVYFVPHDVLHAIPLNALPCRGAGGDALVDRTNTVFAPSVSTLRYCCRKPFRRTGQSLIVGNPLRLDESDIPETEFETRAVASILRSQPHTKRGAVKDVVRDRGPMADFIHLACHGKFCRDDAFASALVLADDDLSAREILDLRLQAELVVLSACETGVAENRSGDELIGLVRAFLYAGARSVMVSLWNAYDKPTSVLMKRFYENHISRNMPKSEALTRAQRELKTMGLPAAQWAPFILIGDWR